MNWLANYMGASQPAPPPDDDDYEDDEEVPTASLRGRDAAKKNASGSTLHPNKGQGETLPQHRGYNWRNRHGQRYVGELRP